ncbi:glycosyltransferase [Paenibacillus frigoriresistens]|uniref:glycosyltransferase n=1 Tax=Paenibacillus alginolyticus TaxID=59839 RepID=UPI0015667440|nr:glycosyltransferase [Paenibacillus frigoriresistens]NRF95266.1 glycosyltransferase [Paenibacillus frigoriresistens]
MYPKVSIIIPFYNCPYIDQAIVSALGQTYPNIEIIVVDDGSTMYADKIQPFLTRIHYLGKANGGTASALNHGIRIASGQYIAWLSSDDLFYPDKIERQLRFMMAHHSSISFTAFDQIDAYNNITGRMLGPQFANVIDFYHSFLTCDPVNGCTVMMKKEILNYIGFFDESLPYTHDYELWIRVILGRIYFHYLYEPLLMYRWHGQMGTMKHRPAIELEVEFIQQKYRPALQQLIVESSR